MYKTDPIALTNQPETGEIPSRILSQAVRSWEVGAEVEFDDYQLVEMDESKIFVFGRVVDGRAKLSKTKILTTMAVWQMLALGTGGIAAEGRRSNSE